MVYPLAVLLFEFLVISGCAYLLFSYGISLVRRRHALRPSQSGLNFNPQGSKPQCIYMYPQLDSKCTSMRETNRMTEHVPLVGYLHTRKRIEREITHSCPPPKKKKKTDQPEHNGCATPAALGRFTSCSAGYIHRYVRIWTRQTTEGYPHYIYVRAIWTQQVCTQVSAERLAIHVVERRVYNVYLHDAPCHHRPEVGLVRVGRGCL